MATNRAGDEVDLTTWIGRTESTRDVVAPTPVAALHATLDYPVKTIESGTALPPLWHWLYFLPMHRQSELGPDGHAERGGFLPPVPLPRRMWAGGRFDFRSPLRVGDDVVRTSTIENVVPKQGRTGPLVFVTVRHEVRSGGASDPALVEHHDIVYRAENSGTAKQPGEVEPPPTAAASGRPLAADDRPGRRPAVPLLGADLQRPPHPLRPPLRHRGRGLPGSDRPRAAARHAAAGPAPAQRTGRRRRHLPLPSGAPDVRPAPVPGQRRAGRRRHRRTVVPGPRGLADHGRRRDAALTAPRPNRKGHPCCRSRASPS